MQSFSIFVALTQFSTGVSNSVHFKSKLQYKTESTIFHCGGQNSYQSSCGAIESVQQRMEWELMTHKHHPYAKVDF